MLSVCIGIVSPLTSQEYLISLCGVVDVIQLQTWSSLLAKYYSLVWGGVMEPYLANNYAMILPIQLEKSSLCRSGKPVRIFQVPM